MPLIILMKIFDEGLEGPAGVGISDSERYRPVIIALCGFIALLHPLASARRVFVDVFFAHLLEKLVQQLYF